MAALPTYIPVDDAAQRLGISPSDLHQLIEAGTIRAAEINGVIAVSEESVNAHTPKEELEEYKQFKHLAGVEIGIGEAARKYQVPQPTISRWVKRGFITKLGKKGQKILLNEQDVAYCARIYHDRGGGIQGRRLFAKDGTPYIPKSEHATLPKAA